MIINLRAAFSSLLMMSAAFCYAQAPNISYNSPQTFNTGTAITVVKPTNTGGAVPAVAYGQVTTFVGTTGASGLVNATGTAARLNGPTTLAVDAAGNIFVTDVFNVVIRKITSAGVVTTYAGSGQFGYQNGAAAQATFDIMRGIAVDAAGNVYVADSGNELIRKITPGGIVSTVAGKHGVSGFANGQDTTATFNNPLGMAVDKSGNLYIADAGNSLIRKITSTGLVSTLAGKQGISLVTNGADAVATFKGPEGCAVDATGNIYVAELLDVRKISPNGQVSTFAGSGNSGSADGVGTAASFSSLTSISIDPLGNLYVTDGINQTVRKITPDGTVSTIAGTPGATGSTNGIGAAARFGDGFYAAAGAAGVLYVTDQSYNIVRKLAIRGYTIGKALPTGLSFDGTTGGISGTPVAFLPATDYTVTGYNLSGSSAAKINITITGTLSFPLIPAQIYGAADFSPATSTSGAITYTSSNTAVATVVSGKLHVVGAGTSTIQATNGSTTLSQVLAVNTAPLTIIADNKSKNYHVANPALTITYDGFVNGESAAAFTTQPTISTAASTTTLPGNYPINVSGAVDKNYSINFVAGTLTILGGSVTTAAPELTYPATLSYTAGTAIATVTPTNTGGAVPANAYAQITVVSGPISSQGSYQGGYQDGPVTTAKFLDPTGITLDAAGNIYIADNGNNAIRKITPTGTVSTIAGKGTNQLNTLLFPSGVAVDAAGNVYITDTFDNEIKEVSPQGVVSLFAGGGSQLNGQGTQASFSGPSGIAIDKSGNLYVCDESNDLIRKITPAGVVTTLAGQQGVQGSANGAATAATFSRLIAIAVDTSNNLYVIDNYLVRKITAAGVVSTLAGSGAYASVDGKGVAASFADPQAITVEPNGIVYVGEYGKIRKITPGGVVSTILGVSTTGTVAQNTLSYVFLGGLTVDPSGNLYVCDIGTNSITKVTAIGYTIDKTLPAGLVFDATTGKISGKPTVGLPPAFFTINAYNLGGASTSIIKLSVAASSVATLSSLKTSNGVLSPGFAAVTTTYTASVVNGVSSMTVTPTATNAGATITVNGTAVTSGTASGPITLAVGANTITIVVTAQDGVTTKTYTLAVTRAASTNANLSALKPSAGTITPVFAAATTSYTESVANTVTSITFTPTTSDPGATVKVNGVTVTSGSPSGAVALSAGANSISVTVIASNGTTTKTYTITVTRATSANANLSSFKPSKGTISPGFSAATTSYTSNVANNVTSITITPTAADANATIAVNGTAVASGSASGAVALSVGANTITTVVTAQDGVTTKTYTLTITRAPGAADEFAGTGISVNKPTETPSLNDDIIAVRQGVSPNGDGINDFLVIDGIQAYPDNKLSIMNRNGQLVYEVAGYDNSSKAFDGHSSKNGQLQLPGTYFYQLDYTVKGITKHKTGYIVLKY